jgi:Uma2 family endonuclease
MPAMAAALRIPGFMTVGEFLNWDAPEGYHWQLVDGVPVAMSPPAPLHGAIHSEINGLIRNHLIERGGACSVITTPGVIPRFQSDRNFMVPDLAVTCSFTDITGKAVHEPVLLIEILSPSNHAETWRNVWAYMTIPTLREILVIRTLSVGVELLRRGDDGQWPDKPLSITEGMFTMSSIDLSLPVAALYRGTGMTSGA